MCKSVGGALDGKSVTTHRAGEQAQYIATPVPEPTADGQIAAGMAWALANRDSPITLDELARKSTLSRRSYLRRFAGATGTTPIKWLIAQRIQASLALLEPSSLSIEQVATRVGFPKEYRSCFTGVESRG